VPLSRYIDEMTTVVVILYV